MRRHRLALVFGALAVVLSGCSGPYLSNVVPGNDYEVRVMDRRAAANDAVGGMFAAAFASIVVGLCMGLGVAMHRALAGTRPRGHDRTLANPGPRALPDPTEVLGASVAVLLVAGVAALLARVG